jgi:hypothetical protein
VVQVFGELTDREDEDTGTITFEGEHGIEEGDQVDISWSSGGQNGSRSDMEVTDVDDDEVTIDGGTGDDLPEEGTAITVARPRKMIDCQCFCYVSGYYSSTVTISTA